ncbi:MAG: methyltransferase domain-containing protein [candidate division WOR-3 bacterium]
MRKMLKLFKAKRLNKHAADPKSKPEEIIRTLGLKPGDIVADIGAGGGYFTLRFADIVGESGRVYAVDVEEAFLKFIAEAAKKRRLNNVVTVPVKNKLPLPRKGLDLVFMRNVTHHLSNRIGYFSELKEFLKDSGKVVIIDYGAESKTVRFLPFWGKPGHYIPRERLIQEMSAAGYVLIQDFDFLSEQHFTIYSQRPKGKVDD